MGDADTTYCRGERRPVPDSEIQIIDGSPIHLTNPPHRVLDGLTVRLDTQVGVPAIAEIAAAPDVFEGNEP